MPGPPEKSAWSDTEQCCSLTSRSGDKMGRRRGLRAKQEQRNREMLAQCEAGVTLAEIGAEHGVSAERVRQIVRRLGVPGTGPSAWSPVNTATLRLLWRKGLSASLIAEQLGVSKNAVTGRANRLDLPSRRPRFRAKRPVLRLSCEICGSTFFARRSAYACSDICRQRVYRQRKRGSGAVSPQADSL